MKSIETPVVPDSLLTYASEDFYDIVDKYSKLSLDSVVQSMPEAQLFNRYRNEELPIHAIRMIPKDYDPTHAVIVPYPFANGHKPHLYLRHKIAQEVLGGKVQIIGIPNNTVKDEFYSYTASQMAKIRDGDAGPIAESILGITDSLRLESIDVVSYSQGAFVGAKVLELAQKRGVLQVKHALIAEPANIVERTDKKLKNDFIKTGISPFIKAVRDSGIPALNESLGIRGNLVTPKIIKDMLAIDKSSKLPINKALHSGMTHDNLLTSLDIVDWMRPESRNESPILTIARSENSKITPRSIGYMMISQMLASKTIEIDGYGHEAADNITGVFSLLVKAALTDEKYDYIF